MCKEKFGINIVYGRGNILKSIAGYPKFLPLFTYMDHGINLSDFIDTSEERNNDAVFMFKFSKRGKSLFQRISNKPCYIIKDPLISIFDKQVKQNFKEGSVFFPSHSLVDLEVSVDWQEYLNNLKLPSQFYPITICLHFVDVEKGLDVFFKNLGYNVVTAGPPSDANFAYKFFDIISKFSFSFSNSIGTYTFYSIHLNIPFSLLENNIDFKYTGNDPFVLKGIQEEKKSETLKKAKKLFNGVNLEVTENQKAFKDEELGIKNGISNLKIMALLYLALLISLIKSPISSLRLIRISVILNLIDWKTNLHK